MKYIILVLIITFMLSCTAFRNKWSCTDMDGNKYIIGQTYCEEDPFPVIRYCIKILDIKNNYMQYKYKNTIFSSRCPIETYVLKER